MLPSGDDHWHFLRYENSRLHCAIRRVLSQQLSQSYEMDTKEDIQRSLGRLEGKLDILITEIKQHFEDDQNNFSSIDTRFQSVEKKIYYASGFVAAIVFISQQFKSYLFPSG
jgi:hypothetical protein